MTDSKKIFSLSDNFLNSIKSPCAIIDRNGKIIFSNSGFSNLFIAINGKNISEIFNISLNQLTELKRVVTDNGFRIALHEIDSGTNKRYLIFAEHLKESTRSENDFKLLNHDLNNIFTGILNNAVMLKQNITDKNLLHYLSGIELGITRASSILDSFLSPELKLTSLHNKIDLGKLIKEVIDSLNNFTAKKVDFNFSFSDNISINGDYNKIFRAVQNICINSIEAIKGKGKIDIRLFLPTSNKHKPLPERKSYVGISIKDNGCGMTKDTLAKIFDKGFSTKDKNRESGLGLSNIKDIVEQHEGLIEVKSKVDAGTEFILYFPFTEKDKNSVLNPAKKINIIVADDEENILELLNDLFLSYNYNVFAARNGAEVLEILSKNRHCDILVIDRKMPLLDGIECIKKIKSLKIKMKIILTTGSPSAKLDMNQLKKIGVTEVLSKPYDFNYLLELIGRII
jgi:signal transduction histidine kinase